MDFRPYPNLPRMTTYFNYPSEELQQELARIAKAIVAPGKGRQSNILPGTLQHSTTSLPWIVLQPKCQVFWLPMSPLAPWESDWQTVALRTLRKTGELLKQNYAQGVSTFISRRETSTV